MHEKVQDYLKKVAERSEQLLRAEEKAQTEKEQRYRNDVLRRAGLVDREYSKDGQPSDDYPLLDAKSDSYYREIPCQITGEEWEAIKAAYEKERAMENGSRPSTKDATPKNGIGGALKAIGIIIYIAAAIGAIVAYSSVKNILPSVYVLCGGIVAGTVMLGFAEIVRLLDCINRNTTRE